MTKEQLEEIEADAKHNLGTYEEIWVEDAETILKLIAEIRKRDLERDILREAIKEATRAPKMSETLGTLLVRMDRLKEALQKADEIK